MTRSKACAFGDCRNASCPCEQSCALLVAHILGGLGIWTDPAHARGLHGAREILVLGRKPWIASTPPTRAASMILSPASSFPPAPRRRLAAHGLRAMHGARQHLPRSTQLLSAVRGVHRWARCGSRCRRASRSESVSCPVAVSYKQRTTLNR
jgi:hypothetical protein